MIGVEEEIGRQSVEYVAIEEVSDATSSISIEARGMDHEQSLHRGRAMDIDGMLCLERLAHVVDLLVDDLGLRRPVGEKVEDENVVLPDAVQDLGSPQDVHEVVPDGPAKVVAQLWVSKP